MLRVVRLARSLVLGAGLLLLSLVRPAGAVEDKVAIAIAVPVEGITIDGDLSDWPAGMVRYPLTVPEGVELDSAEDFRGEFRLGWNAEEKALYVAVEVQDTSVVAPAEAVETDTLRLLDEDEVNALYSAQDGCMVSTRSFFSRSTTELIHKEGLSTTEIPDYGYAAFGNSRLWSCCVEGDFIGGWMLGPWEGAELGVKRLGDMHQYEWRVDLEKLRQEGSSGYPEGIVDLVVAVWDKDRDKGGMRLSPTGVWPPVGKGGLIRSEIEPNVLLADEDVSGALGKALALVGGSVVVHQKEHVRSETRAVTTYQMLSMGTLAVFTLLHLLLFLFYPRSKTNLHYAQLTGSLFMVLSLGYQDHYGQNITNNAFSTWLSSVSPPLYHLAYFLVVAAVICGPLIFGLRFLYSLFYVETPRQFRGLLVAAGLSLLSLLARMAGIVHDMGILPAVVTILAYIAEVLRVVVVAIVKKKDGAWYIGSGLIGFVLTTVYVVVSRFGADSFFLWVMILVVPMSIYLAQNVGRTSMNLEVQLVQVEELSAKNLEQERTLRAEAEKELQTAHEMQMALMPKAPPQIQGFEITGRCIPANHVGGDLFQYFHQHDRLSISLADVTGHAMEAAIPVVMFSGILKSQMENSGPIEELFGRLNRSLHNAAGSRTFVCFAFGTIDTRTSTLRLSSAAFPYPYHFRAATGEIAELQVDAYLLGVRPDTTYSAIERHLAPGDYLVFCSDGIIEATDVAGAQFGYERTAASLRSGCAAGLSAAALLERIVAEVKEFRGEVPQGDDQTVVVLRVEV